MERAEMKRERDKKKLKEGGGQERGLQEIQWGGDTKLLPIIFKSLTRGQLQQDPVYDDRLGGPVSTVEST